MKQNETIEFIITGGTIDSYYDGRKDTAVPNKESVIPTFIDSLRPYFDAEYTIVAMKDSRDINQDDRNNILKVIEGNPNSKYIITHGTYTAPDTARFLKANLKTNDKTVIITGSMIPIQGFSPSDGTFNLGYAIAQLEYVKPGVYVAFNGRIFDPEEVIKILNEGRFSSIWEK